ncbi:MAG: type II toxin-antitoxin system HicB family antitoxin [Eubacterium sp.]|nr:type II toxin-antitoxin system HicB family antitoxin [Eubacterium sp.]
MKLTYPACFYPCDQKEGGYTVEVPDLPGCVSEGDSLADAIIMATDAASGWVLDELEDGRPIPPASKQGDIIPDDGGFVNMLVLDMDTYAEKYGDKAVRKNLTIPAWLNTFAEKNHINFSQVLQDALTVLFQKNIAK